MILSSEQGAQKTGRSVREAPISLGADDPYVAETATLRSETQASKTKLATPGETRGPARYDTGPDQPAGSASSLRALRETATMRVCGIGSCRAIGGPIARRTASARGLRKRLTRQRAGTHSVGCRPRSGRGAEAGAVACRSRHTSRGLTADGACAGCADGPNARYGPSGSSAPLRRSPWVPGMA